MNSIQCRLAVLSDVPAMLELEQSAFPRERWASQSSLEKRLELPDAVTWLAYVDGKPAGFSNGFPIGDFSTQEELDPDDAVLYQRRSSVWLLRNVAVHRSFQRAGVGTRLIESQLASAREYGAKYFRFTATENLTGYYSKLGFQMIRPPEAFHGLPQAVWEKRL
jgi:GNAT superfamily N-acetyltransferase